jgi:hypothetical protein
VVATKDQIEGREVLRDWDQPDNMTDRPLLVVAFDHPVPGVLSCRNAAAQKVPQAADRSVVMADIGVLAHEVEEESEEAHPPPSRAKSLALFVFAQTPLGVEQRVLVKSTSSHTANLARSLLSDIPSSMHCGERGDRDEAERSVQL